MSQLYESSPTPYVEDKLEWMSHYLFRDVEIDGVTSST